ncbi:putative ribonuclease H-like domain-containing protein, partial [Tanacetum coccineum]
KVWTLVDLPNGKRAIGTKRVFRNKKDERGIIVRNKARLVTQDYTQEKGINYDEVFAPIARIEAIRLFLAYASYMGFIVYQMDVKSALLYGTIEEEVEKDMYGLHQPPGFDVDYLSKSMNYVPVVAGNQTNGIVGTKDNIVIGPKDNEEDAEVKPTDVDESKGSDKDGKDEQDSRSEFERLLQQKKQTEHPNNTNSINTVSIPVSTDEPSSTYDAPSSPVNIAKTSEEHLIEQFSPFKNAFTLPDVLNVSPMDNNNGFFVGAYDDEDVDGHADLNNLETTMNKVWTLVDLPNGKRAIGTKWVFRRKKDESGIVVRNKARLVAQGYTQEEGIDYDEVFALVSRIEAIKLFFAYASYMGFIVYLMDVNSAFLYGTIEEEVYVCQPLGFEDPYFPDKVYKVEKALYGLHQAPRAWYETLSTYLMENRFRRGTIDKTLFIKKDNNDAQDILDEFYGGAHLLLRILKDTITPMEAPQPNKALVKDEEADNVDVHLYRSMIGSLMYLTASRPDITFAVCACARFQVTPKTSHLHAVKRIFRYLKGQPKLGLWYPRDSPFDLEAFSDSDYAGASLDRKSTTGGCQFLGKRLISWQCKKQTIVANSTTEAEYVAAANCCGQVLWIQNQMLDYGFNFMNTKIYIDNESTICIVKNPKFHAKTKHIEIRHHFIRDSYEKRLIQVIKVHSDQNVADLLTKAFDVSSPLVKVGDEAVHKELGDRMERAVTAASSLEAEQDSGNINRTQSMATLNEPSP